MSQEENSPVFAIEKLYVKDLSVEVPHAPEIFLQRETPELDVQLRSEGKGLGDGLYDVVLTVTVTAKLEDKTVFLAEVGQGGVFRILNVPEENMEPLLAIAAPNVLFPYAREVVSTCVAHAGFAPVVLQPVNFEALYLSRKAEEQEAAGDREVPIQ